VLLKTLFQLGLEGGELGVQGRDHPDLGGGHGRVRGSDRGGGAQLFGPQHSLDVLRGGVEVS
jgi:hypothetical protein